uniref:Uncharacterized protein n=1 Tax=Anguilla anguilla TaxID=7936 RepID=A0A0E9PZP1_ANGAN
MVLGLLQVTQVLVSDVLSSPLVHLLSREPLVVHNGSVTWPECARVFFIVHPASVPQFRALEVSDQPANYLMLACSCNMPRPMLEPVARI